MLKSFWEKQQPAEQAIKAWYDEVKEANWNSPNELKSQFRTASIISEKRVIFNIHGNRYRLIVDIEYRLKIVFIIWIGTHSNYDKINAKEIEYASPDTKRKSIRRSSRKSK